MVKDGKFSASERAEKNHEIPKEFCDMKISLFVGNCPQIPLVVTLSSWLGHVFPLESVTFVSSILRVIAFVLLFTSRRHPHSNLPPVWRCFPPVVLSHPTQLRR